MSFLFRFQSQNFVVTSNILWCIDLLLGNLRDTHATNNKGPVVSVVIEATIILQRAIHAANVQYSVFCAALYEPSLYNERLFVARGIRELELGVHKL
jgi:hypothetical protein